MVAGDAASVFGVHLPPVALECTTLAFRGQPFLDCRAWGFGLFPRFGRLECLGNQGSEPADGGFAILELAAAFVGCHSQVAAGVDAVAEPAQQTLALFLGETRAPHDVPPHFNAGGCLVHMLSAGAACPADLEAKLVGRYGERHGHAR